MRRKYLDLVAIMSIALLNIALTLHPINVKIIQLMAVFPLVFIVPGYLVTLTLFQRRKTDTVSQTPSFFARNAPRSLDAWEYLVLSIGLSIAIDVVGGFLLNLLPVGLTKISWIALLGVLTLILGLVAAMQRLSRPQGNFNTVPQASPARLSFTQISLFALAGVIVVLTILFSINSAQQQPYPGFTQFWMLPPQSHQSSCTVQLGIQNFEGKPITYRVTMEVNGILSERWTSIVLSSQQEWNRVVSITLRTTTLTKSITIEAQLYRMDKASLVYRQVHIQLPVVKKNANGQLLQCAGSS